LELIPELESQALLEPDPKLGMGSIYVWNSNQELTVGPGYPEVNRNQM